MVETRAGAELSQLEEESTGPSSFGVVASRAYNTFVDQVNMPRGPGVLEPVQENAKSVKPVKPVNPYTPKPYYVDNRHTFVPGRDIRPPKDPSIASRYRKKPPRPEVIIMAGKDDALGHIGGAEIDFGNSKKDGNGNKKVDV